MWLHCLSVRQPFVELILLELKNGESRCQDWLLSDRKDQYILLHESNTVDPEQLKEALKIAADRNVKVHVQRRCKTKCAKDQMRGRVVAIIKLGETHCLTQQDLHTKEDRLFWEHRTFVPTAQLKQNPYVTTIEEVHPFPTPWKMSGQLGLFPVRVRLRDLPSNLDSEMLEKSLYNPKR